MGTIEEVKDKTDIVEVVSQYTTLTKAGRTFRGLCPFHHEKHGSFFVYPEQQSWHCFGACSTGGDVFSFVMKKENLDFGEALRLLAQRAGLNIGARFEAEPENKEKERIYQVNLAAAQYYHNLLVSSPAGTKPGTYLAGRGLIPATITDFQLGYSLPSWETLNQYLAEKGYSENELLAAGLIIRSETGGTHDRFRNRIMFPIFDLKGRVTGFGARAMDQAMPKYLNSPQTPVFDKSACLYGINFAAPAIRQKDGVVVVEGYMDVLMAHQLGVKNVIASMGTAITEKQISILKRLTRNVTLALDSDAAGEEAMLRAVDTESSLGAEVRMVVLPPGRDPDEVIKDDVANWRRLVDGAIPIIDYTFDVVTSGLDLNLAGAKSQAAARLLPIISRIKDDVRRDHYLNKLAKQTETQYSSLERALSKVKMSAGARALPRKTVPDQRRPATSSKLERYYLSLLLHHPELKEMVGDVRAEYFENSENRAVFLAWRECGDPEALRARVDDHVWQYADTLLKEDQIDFQVELKCTDCGLRLRDKYLRNLEKQRQQAFSLAVETAGTGADLARLREEGIDPSIQLWEVEQKRRQGLKKGAR